jgi:GST-like protein
MLEEVALPYRVHAVDISKGEQFRPEFVAINPNSKIPAILDEEGPGGKPVTVFESGAILIYLAEKTGKLMPRDARRRIETLQWLMFQMGGVGPMFGQWNHFGAYAKERIPYAIERYTNEVHRLSRVLNKRLEESHWLAGDEYSMADIITFPWLRTAAERSPRFDERGYVELAEYPALKRWYDEISVRPAVQRGLAVLSESREQKQITEAEREVMFGRTQFAAR